MAATVHFSSCLTHGATIILERHQLALRPAVCSSRHSTTTTTHSHRHWPPCLPQSLPLPSPSRSTPLQAQKLPPPRCIKKLRSRATRSTMNSSGHTPRSRTLLGDRRLSRRTQRYISPEKKEKKKRRTMMRIEGNTMSTGHIQMNPQSLHSFTGSQTLRARDLDLPSCGCRRESAVLLRIRSAQHAVLVMADFLDCVCHRRNGEPELVPGYS